MKQAIRNYSNDLELGSFVRQLYENDSKRDELDQQQGKNTSNDETLLHKVAYNRRTDY